MELANVDPYYLRAPHPGVVTHQSSNFARNLLDEIQVATEGETGDVGVDREGFIAFRERLTLGAHPREDDVQLTWANDERADSIGPSEFGTGHEPGRRRQSRDVRARGRDGVPGARRDR